MKRDRAKFLIPLHVSSVSHFSDYVKAAVFLRSTEQPKSRKNWHTLCRVFSAQYVVVGSWLEHNGSRETLQSLWVYHSFMRTIAREMNFRFKTMPLKPALKTTGDFGLGKVDSRNAL